MGLYIATPHFSCHSYSSLFSVHQNKPCDSLLLKLSHFKPSNMRPLCPISTVLVGCVAATPASPDKRAPNNPLDLTYQCWYDSTINRSVTTHAATQACASWDSKELKRYDICTYTYRDAENAIDFLVGCGTCPKEYPTLAELMMSPPQCSDCETHAIVTYTVSSASPVFPIIVSGHRTWTDDRR